MHCFDLEEASALGTCLRQRKLALLVDEERLAPVESCCLGPLISASFFEFRAFPPRIVGIASEASDGCANQLLRQVEAY